jgi:hypothetical protein
MIGRLLQPGNVSALAVTSRRWVSHHSDPSLVAAGQPPLRHVGACAGRQSVHAEFPLESSHRGSNMRGPFLGTSNETENWASLANADVAYQSGVARADVALSSVGTKNAPGGRLVVHLRALAERARRSRCVRRPGIG